VFEFIESAAFDRLRAHYLDDDEYGELQQFMMQNPEVGALVRGEGTFRSRDRQGADAGGARGPASVVGCA